MTPETIDRDSLVESLQGIILAQTQTMAMMFKVLVQAGLMDPDAALAQMRSESGDSGNDMADDILRGQADALEGWLANKEAEPAPVFTVIDGGKKD